ncbi:MAG TPA: hypothetical protein VJZ75_08645, partial [Candidatus Bathyarchaeia archaeon]|nr:hypothetical protein [Candidatus Bathyarchaeia archaeon]
MEFKSEDRLTIVTDAAVKELLPRILFDTARQIGNRVVLFVTCDSDLISGDPPLMDLLKASDIIIVCTSKHIPLKAREEITRAGRRILLMHTLSDKVAIRTIPVDYGRIKAALDDVATALYECANLYLTSPKGTDLRFSCKGRPILKFDGLCTDAGEFESLPAGWVRSAPLEGMAEGTIVIDGAGYHTGVIRNPIKLTIHRGVVTTVSGGEEAGRLRKLIEDGGENSGNLAEFGIGANPQARVGPIPIETERSAGSASFGLGRNTQNGGTVNSKVHLDIGVSTKVNLKADCKLLIEKGRIKK